MAARPRVLVVGSLVADYVAVSANLPRPGETLLGKSFDIYPGGKGANQAVQAARLGAEVHMIGRVGDDASADFLLHHLQQDGVRADHVVRDPTAGTAACCIHVDAAGKNAIVIVPRANAHLSPEHIDRARSLFESADVVLTQLEIPLPAVERTLAIARELGVPTILNPAPAQPLAETILRMVDWLTPNEIEAATLSGISVSAEASESLAAATLRSKGARQVVVTLGERGCLLCAGNDERRFSSFSVEAIDSTAAGDAFNGALAVAIAERMSIDDALRFASAAGALSVTRRGAQPSLARRDEVDRLLECGK